MRRFAHWCGAGIASLVTAVTVLAWAGSAVGQAGPDAPPEVRFEDFIGAEECGSCHRQEYQQWRKSTHGNAGGPPSTAAFISSFDGTVLRFADATVTLEVDDAQRYFYHVDQPGKARQSFEVAGFVGGGHMMGGGTQASFSRYSDGSWRLLPFDYSRHSDLWFCDVGRAGGWLPITPDLSLDSCAFWPPQSNFGPNCGNCHSSQMEGGFDAGSQRERLRFMSLAINCESCHGPGRRHAELMRQPDRHTLTDIGIQPLELLDKQRSVEVCFRCHAKTQPLAPGYLPGKPLAEHYALNFYSADSRHLDGRSNGWSYQEGHLYSDCFVNGSMTCVDCHDPHAQGYRDIDGFALPGKLDDGQCLDCHPAKALNIRAHTGHPPASPGSRCVACHMPFLQQTGIGRQVKFSRSDHTIPIPRPAFDAALGLDTACAACHRDKSVAWQQEQVDRWHGASKPHRPIIATLLQLRRGADPAQARRVLQQQFDRHPPAELDLLLIVADILDLPATDFTLRQRQRLEEIADAGAMDAGALARSWLLRPAADGGAASRWPVATRRRVALWLNEQAVEDLAQLQVEPAIDALEKCLQLDPRSLRCHLALAEAYDLVGRPGDALKTLRAATGARLLTRQDYLDILDNICAVLDGLGVDGMQRNPAMERICSADMRQPAVPVPADQDSG